MKRGWPYMMQCEGRTHLRACSSYSLATLEIRRRLPREGPEEARAAKRPQDAARWSGSSSLGRRRGNQRMVGDIDGLLLIVLNNILRGRRGRNPQARRIR